MEHQHEHSHAPNFTHSHPHSHLQGHAHAHNTNNSLRTAFFLNLAFTIFEIIGGLWTNSMAILSDAVHDLGDSVSLGMAWFLERYSRRGKDNRFSYGYRRFSLLGAMLNILVLLVGGFVILSEAVPRLLDPQHSNAQGMVLFAIVGILVNGAAVLRLRGGQSINAQVVAWHLLEDVLGWVAVLIVSIILLFWDIHILDPLLSILITLYVLFNVLRNLKRTAALFLQAVPESIDLAMLEGRLLALDKVCSVHHTHLWSLDGEHHVLTAHVVVAENATRDDVLQVKQQANALAAQYRLAHTTLEIEYEDEDCRMKETQEP
jgi:cobalt-zinc-cadmium efflux system protein